jgi:BirA family biotin operon repressor/biotin-[acetyl-CoA-carboxylase] ligase
MFAQPPLQVSTLTLALGVGAAEALHMLGADQVRLKWPNDLLVGNAKLGGILTETQYRNKDEVVAVAGIGLNVALPDRIEVEFDSPYAPRAVDLKSILPQAPQREELTLLLVEKWCETIRDFEREGFVPFLRRFEGLDWLHGQSIRVATGSGNIDGFAIGVSDAGALQVETNRGRTEIISGSIIAARAL